MEFKILNPKKLFNHPVTKNLEYPPPPPAQHIFKFKTTYFACIVNDSEVCFWAELWDFELCMFTVFFDDFFNKSFVCGLRKPAFLIQEGKQSHGLQNKMIKK